MGYIKDIKATDKWGAVGRKWGSTKGLITTTFKNETRRAHEGH